MANVPNPTSETSLSRRSPRFTAASTASVARSANALEVPLLRIFCTSSTRAALFIAVEEGAQRRNAPSIGQTSIHVRDRYHSSFTEICHLPGHDGDGGLNCGGTSPDRPF